MPRSLLIAVRFHEGRYHGAEDGFDGAKGWPPSPARLFQALVASAAKGSRIEADDQDALLWLERLQPPRLSAPAAHHGQDVKLFVPNNDLDSVGGDPALVSKIRAGKTWRPCLFEAKEPVLYAWEFDSGEGMAWRVCSIAERLCQLGRGIDMAWADGQVVDQEKAEAAFGAHSGVIRIPGGVGQVPIPHRGTFDSLVRRHAGNRSRLRTEGTGRKQVQLFSQPPTASFIRTGYDTPNRRLHFELRNPKGGFAAQPLDSAYPLVVGLRDAAANRLIDSMPSRSALVEKLIVGRNAGPAELARRIRILPIPSVGTGHTDPSIRRVLVEIPTGCPLRLDDLNWAFSGVSSPGSRQGVLVSTTDSRMADRFFRPALAFETVTPVALSSAQRRRIGATGQKSAQERQQEERVAIGAVLQSLRHIGVKDRPIDVQLRKEPFQRRGALAECFAQGSRFSKHALWHVALRFGSPVLGPLVVGDGRFCGLGLMLPQDSRDGLLAFDLGRQVAQRDWHHLVHGLRRALMSLAADDRGDIPRLFSGHEPDGQADHAGHHAHIFLAADASGANLDANTRLIVAAPWSVDRTTKPQRGEQLAFGDVVRKLRDLRAGSSGRFRDLAAYAVEDDDPLVRPASDWESQTPYVATRNAKRAEEPRDLIKSDVATECRRRGLPKPQAIELNQVTVGPRGGRPTAMVKLRFSVAVRGPIWLGRSSHEGGGLFHSAARISAQTEG